MSQILYSLPDFEIKKQITSNIKVLKLLDRSEMECLNNVEAPQMSYYMFYNLLS